jgi:2-polyprenyl-6-methoxyphenol hydroxylase-like FAD-dependent oxidoreductase
MLPFMAQGAAQALEDGATLTACLTTRPTSRRPCASTSAAPAAASRIQALSTEN